MRKTNNYRIEHSENNSDPKFIRFLKSLNWMRIILVVTAVYAVLSVSLRFITISQQKQKRNELMAKKESIMEEIESLENEKDYVLEEKAPKSSLNLMSLLVFLLILAAIAAAIIFGLKPGTEELTKIINKNFF